MEEGNKKSEELRKNIEKLMDYPIGKRLAYLMNYKAEPPSLEERLENVELKLAIVMRQTDLFIRMVFNVAEKYDDEVMKSLAAEFKRMPPHP